METLQRLNLGFSTADAEFPDIHLEDGHLKVEYADWQEHLVKLCFAEPVAFKWQMTFDLLRDERDDCYYEVHNSNWVKQHIRADVISEDEAYTHFKLNFNNQIQIEVISLSLVWTQT